MASWENVPDDIVIELLLCGILDYTDVVNLSLTCKRFNTLLNRDSVWKIMFVKKWPSFLLETAKFKRIIDKGSKDEISCWKILHRKVSVIFQQLDTLHRTYFHEDHLDDKVFDIFLEYCHQFSFDFVHAVLHDIVTDTTSISLTDKYYAKKVFHYTQSHYLQPQVQNLTSVDDSDKTKLSKLVQGAILIQRWFDPINEYPENPIEVFFAEASNKATNYYNTLFDQPIDEYTQNQREYRKYLAINRTLFGELGFTGNRDLGIFRDNDPEIGIHKVVDSRRGISAILGVVYVEIARRLDFKLEYVNNPDSGGDYLRWKVDELASEHPTASEIADAYEYIDVLNGGAIANTDLISDETLLAAPLSTSRILFRLTFATWRAISNPIMRAPYHDLYLQLSAYDLSLLFEPENYEARKSRMELNIMNIVNLETASADNLAIPDDVRKHLSLPSAREIEKKIARRAEKKEKRLQSYEPTIHQLSDDDSMSVNYCVGMVVELQHEGCVGVIRGWDAECDPAQIHAGAVTWSMARKRPGWAFYHVLVDAHDMERYVPEDFMRLVQQEEEVHHSQIGRYFSATSCKPFRHYIPNTELSRRYPDDQAHAQAMIEEFAANPDVQFH